MILSRSNPLPTSKKTCALVIFPVAVQKQPGNTGEKAAELMGLDIYDFMAACKQNEVAVIDISKEELQEELAGMRSL